MGWAILTQQMNVVKSKLVLINLSICNLSCLTLKMEKKFQSHEVSKARFLTNIFFRNKLIKTYME